MIKYADRHYYSQQVREIEQCIRQSKGTDTAWARKLISAMQGEKGQGKYMAYQAEEFIKKDQARVDRLIEAVNDLLNNAVAPEPKPKPKPKPKPDPTYLQLKCIELLKEPKGSRHKNISTRAIKDILSYFAYHADDTEQGMVEAETWQEVQKRFVTGKKTAQFIFERLKPLRTEVDLTDRLLAHE